GDVAAPGPDPAVVRRPVRVPALARPALRAGVRRAVGRGQPRPAGSPPVSATDVSMLEPAVAADELAPPPTSTPSRRFRWSVVLGPLVAFVLFVGLWEYMHRDGMRRFFDKPGFLLPSPATVIDQSFVDPNVRHQMLTGLAWTALVAIVGLLITIVIGI